MKKLLIIIIIVVLVVPIAIYLGLYSYGVFQTEYAKHKRNIQNIHLDKLTSSGNGFGGESGFKVLDSGYSADKYFWLDSDHLVFLKKWTGKDENRNYVWDVNNNVIKPIEMVGSINCFRDGYIYYGRFTGDRDDRGRKKIQNFRAKIAEIDTSWVLPASTDITQLWPVPSERYELSWTDACKPWFRPKYADGKSPDYIPHRFKYLPELDAVVKTEAVHKHDENRFSPGIYSIKGDVYDGYGGVLMSELPVFKQVKYSDLEFKYLGFIDKYMVSNWVYVPEVEERIVSFMNRDFEFKYVIWPKKWEHYSSPPLLTKKGFIWSGRKKKESGSSGDYVEGFFWQGFGRVYKVIQGSIIGKEISLDGCKLAFINQPKTVGKTRLMALDICNSVINGEDFIDVSY